MDYEQFTRGNVVKKMQNKRKEQASTMQVGGDHYKQYAIQPIEFITKNNIPYIEGNIIKYIVRWKDKNGVEDLDKIIHYIELLKEIEKFKNESD